MPASKGEIMKRPITLAVLSALVLSSAVAVQVTAASSESNDTQCWDVYNKRGTRKRGTIAPTGLNPDDCTPAIGCYYGYRASDGQRTQWVVPYGMNPKNACSPDGSTPTTAAPTPRLLLRRRRLLLRRHDCCSDATTAAPTPRLLLRRHDCCSDADDCCSDADDHFRRHLDDVGLREPVAGYCGRHVTLSATMRSDVERNVLVDLEAYSASGQKVFQFWWDNQSFAAGESKTLSTNWTVPSSLAGRHVHAEDRRVRCRLGRACRVERCSRQPDSGFDLHDNVSVCSAVGVGEVCDVAGGCGVAVGC